MKSYFFVLEGDVCRARDAAISAVDKKGSVSFPHVRSYIHYQIAFNGCKLSNI